jgi:hypothetical protein
MRDGSRGPVTVECLQSEASRREIALHGGECHRGFSREQALAGLVPIDPSADEVIVAEITCVDLKSGDDLSGIDEARMTRVLCDRGMRDERKECE